MNKLKYEFRNLNVFMATATSAIFLLINFSVWCAVGSPVYVLRFISAYVATLPLWIFGLFDFISYILLGFSFGSILTVTMPICQVYKYRGAFYFTLGIVLALLHHVFFFSGAKFFSAMLIALLQCFFLAIALINFGKVSKLASFIAFLGALWSVYLLVLNVITFFLM